ncbi:MAG: hypothetical protein RMJ82_00070 [Gemmatales bacterium]|nr:hypothetical protein [Gemmatales bacterium]
MTPDEKVTLAEKIAKSLIDVSRNEWQKWVNYFAQTGKLERAVQLAQSLGNSIWLRPDPKRSAQTIASVIGKQYASQLKKLPPDELEELFGYAGRCLKILEFERKQKEQKAPPSKSPQQSPPRGGGRR